MSNANFARTGSLPEIYSFAVTPRLTRGKPAPPTLPGSGWPRAAASSLRKFANFASGQARNSRYKLLVISGPTATGKTKLAFKLAKQFGGELVSADSRQVYKGMDIGTGKEFSVQVKSQKSKVKIFGYDLIFPNQEWSTSHFVKLANKLISEIQNRGKLPIVVGGTGLYIANLLNPPETLNIPPDKELRLKLEKLSVAELQDRLKKINPGRFVSMNGSDQSNPRRLIRAIEVVKFPELHKKGPAFLKRPGLFKHIALTASLDVIDKRIEQRVMQRVDQGVEQEVKALVKKYGWDSALSFTIGYKEWKQYIGVSREKTENREQGTENREQRAENREQETMITEIVKLWATHEKQYARRQLVWMAKYFSGKLFDISKSSYYQDIEAYVSRWYYGKR